MPGGSRMTAKSALVVAAVVCGIAASILGPVVTVPVALAFFAVVRRVTTTSRAPRGQRPPRLRAGLAGIAALLIVLITSAPTELRGTSQVLGTLTVALGFLPFIVWSQRRDLPVPVFPAITGIYVLYFGVPVFLTSTWGALSRPVAPETIVPAQWMALGGLVMMELAYYWVVSRSAVRATSKVWSPRVNTEPESLWLWMGALGILTYFFASTVSVPVALAQPVTLLSSLAALVAVECYLRWRRGVLSVQGAVFLALLIPARVVLGFGTGANFEALSILIALGVAAATIRRRIPWPAVAVAIAAIVVLQPVKLAFRETEIYRSEVSLLRRAGGYATTAKDYAQGNGEFDDAGESFVVRYGFLSTLAAVMTDTPDSVPYWGGATYTPILSKIFPRILLPWKPTEITGQTFGHRFNLLHDADTKTSYNMPIVVEFYANFGPAGVLVGMFALGAFYAWAQLFALRKVQAAFGTGAAIFVLAQLAYIESALSFVLSGFLYAVVLVYAMRFGARLLRSRRPELGLRAPAAVS